jgi:unsaturated chondroitin disaccharide hydrolase
MISSNPIELPELKKRAERLFELSAGKILSLKRTWKPSQGAPVFTVTGTYTSRGWTEWTHGFQFGSALLQFEATGDQQFLRVGRDGTHAFMPKHLSHRGVHDHGFSIVSTYGNLLRLIREGVVKDAVEESRTCEIALKVSGAMQASRWTNLPEGRGYIYSFNGPHSLFADTIRSLRSLAIADQLGHVLMEEGDREVNLLHRLLVHAETTARYNVYFGHGRDAYDVRGRVAHESIFNTNDGSYRCPASQQGYSPFTTWTRALAWILLGYAEELEYLASVSPGKFPPGWKKKRVLKRFEEVATAVADYYISECPSDGVPYWDTGAPGLLRLGDYRSKPADPFNDAEPVDSSAAAIAAQGFLRLGEYLNSHSNRKRGLHYIQTGLIIARTLFDDPYLSTNPRHQGLLLHSVYHRPNNWDYVPKGSKIPRGESSMWGDYHARELALMILRMGSGKAYRFWGSDSTPQLPLPYK